MASRKEHKTKIIINTQRLDKNTSNRRSNDKNLTPKQIVNKIHKEIRGNSQPPGNADYVGGVTTSYETKNASVKETQEMQKQRQMLIQQYTHNQQPRNVSAFNQQVKVPIDSVNAEHNFMMNQTASEFSPNKKPNSHRRQVALSPKPKAEKSFSYYQNDITEMDQKSNYKTHDNGNRSQRKDNEQYEDFDLRQKNKGGRTRTILTSLGVEQQPVQISKKIQENANKNLINENLYQAQLNGQIKVQHDIQGLRNQGNYQSAQDSKKQQNFFQSKTAGPNSELKSPMREQTFLPSIDQSFRGNANNLPPEVKIPQLYPGTPGKSHIKQGFNLKIGDTTAEIKITINNSQTPRPTKQQQNVVVEKKKMKKESSSQNARQKQLVVNHQKVQSDPLRANKDRQLEDLNETLQRLAREKQNAINGRINLTTSRRKPNKIELIQDAKTPGYRLEVSDPYFMDEDAQEKLRLKKKQHQAEQDLQNFKYKLETNNRVQPGGRLIMGDNMLTSQRLQGIKQVNITNPKSISSQPNEKEKPYHTKKQSTQHIQYQAPIPPNTNKIYKINKQDIQMESDIYKQTPNGSLFQNSQQPSEEYQNPNLKNLKDRGVRNIIVESHMQIPTFGPDQQASLSSRQSSPLLNSPAVEMEDKVRRSINYEIESNHKPTINIYNKRSQETKHRPEKSLKIGCRFSSVLEDVEKEQMASPSPLNKKRASNLQIKINQNLKTESNFNKNSQKSNLQMNLIGDIANKEYVKQTDPDIDTLSRQDIMLDSRDGGDGGLPSDLIEVRGEKERENINISDLEMTPATPDIKNRSIKKNQIQNETTYSQVFNLQNNNKLEHQQIKPSDTIDKKTLQNALKPPLQQKEHNSRYNVHQTTTSINRRRQSNTELDVAKPQSNSSINVKQRGKQLQTGKTIEVKRENSIQSNGSGQEKRQRKMIEQAQKTQKITTPRGKLAVSLGNGMQDIAQSVSPSQKASPTSKNEKRQEKPKKPVARMASQYIDLKNPENTYLPQIESRQNSKSPMRQIQKPPMPSKNDRIESLNLTKTKFGGNLKNNQKSSKRHHDLKRPTRTQFESITHKIDISPGDSSSDIDENMKALKIGKSFKQKRENQSFCQDYCQYRGQQLPKKYKSIFTGNKYRKVEGGFVLSQRLFLSNECAESEDRRMMPILVINLDGAMGYWDDYNKYHYVLRPKIVDSLIQLSYDFRLVAVSSKKQKYMFRLIYGLMNLNEDQHTKHLYFDAVYQLGSSTDEKNEMCTIKNIEEIQFDLTQVLLDMQFKRQQIQKKILETITPSEKNEFLTFWESKLYRPHNKMVIFTTERYLNKNHCYSFDYNYLYQATKFKNEFSKKSPIVIQMPHLRVNPKISFEIIHQLIFALQNITQAISTENQDRSKIVDGKYYENPEISSFQVCKKFLSFKWNILEKKMRNNGSIKGLRVFDSNNDPYVNLGNIDFNESYKFIKKYFANRKSNWLKIQKYYLNTKQSKFEKIHKIKLMAKVTFNDSPEIIRMGEENGSQKIAIGTTHDSSKAESHHPSTRANQYMSDDAKNLYNGLMIRNFKMQQEINAYARHHRILFQHKMAKQKQEEKQMELSLRPIVIFDGEEDDNSNPKSGLRQYGKLKSSINHDNKEKVAEQLSLLQQTKKYSFKFRTLQVRTGEFYEQWNTQDCDLSKYTVIDLKVKVTQDSFEKKGGQEQNLHTGRGDKGDNNPKSNLIEYLSKKQGRIAYTTSQETHLKNNLSQLVDGKQQYVDQQKELQEQDKEQLPSINDKDANQNLHQNYLDLI